MTAPHSLPSVSDKVLRQFALVVGVGFIGIFGLLLPWLWERAYPFWPWILAAVLGLGGLVAPRLLAPLYKGWMKIGHVLGWINTRIILGVVFFVVIWPAGLIMRVFRKDPMARHIHRSVKSYRIPSNQSPPDQITRPF
jgi:hypothetical protein